MKLTALGLPGLMLIEPRVFGDERGFFFESWNRVAFRAATGLDLEFVQDSHSKSQGGVLRGLHYQLPPSAQGKLVRVIAGEVFDVAVDLRRSSPTFGSWAGDVLSAENKHQLWIPPGFAHGFLTLSASAELVYKATETYAPELERCIRWDDQTLAIAWPLAGAPLVSEKDRAGVAFGAAECFA